MNIKPVKQSLLPENSQKNDTVLRKSAIQLEGLFVNQMYKAMRATIPEGDPTLGSSGASMFTELLDEHIAADTPKQWDRGLHEAIYRHLRAKL